MRQTIRILGIFLLVAAGSIALAQKQDKIFYDINWKRCNESIASFYRIITIDENGKPIGKINDYFITGEHQGEIEGALYIDKNDDDKSKFIGKSIGYYKSGQKSFVQINDLEGNETSNTQWYENGNKEIEIKFKNGKYDGFYISYYENGNIKNKQEFRDGKPVDKWFIECDEFERCQKIYFEDFGEAVVENRWESIDTENYKSEVIPLKGLSIKTKSDEGYAKWIYLPIEIKNNFSIETIINFKRGEMNNGQGIIYGFKDWNNFHYYIISANGYYRIGVRKDGLNMEYAEWTPSKHINKNSDRNHIKVNKVNDKVFFSINGELIFSGNFYGFNGNNIGFYIPSGKKEVLFENIIIKEDIVKNGKNSNSSNKSYWKGNGTGFFIDAKGYVVTNYHVVEGVEEIEIDLIQKGQKKSFKAKIIASDRQNDLSVIKIDDKNFEPYSKLPYSFKTQISDIGSSVFVLGYPMALSGMGDELKFTDGRISSKTGFQGDITTYQISVPVQPGNSGGPLFDNDGNIIGVVSSKIMEADNVSYAIKSNYLQNLLDGLPERINVPRDQTLSSMSLTEKIKILSDFVVLIKVK